MHPLHVSHCLSLISRRISWDDPACNPIATLRATLLPGLAQMWYRVLYFYTAVWPWPLLQLLCCSDAAVCARIAQAFLDANPCDLDSGLSVPLRRYLHRRYGSEGSVPVAVVAELQDELLRTLLQQWRDDMEVSVVDIECRHARHRRGEHGGRPPNFATAAAQCFLRECTILHAQVSGVPQGYEWCWRVRKARHAMLAGSTQCRFSRTGRRQKLRRKSGNPFMAFRANCERRCMAAWASGIPNPLGLLPEEADAAPRTRTWEQAVARLWKSGASSSHRWVLEAAAARVAKRRRSDQSSNPAPAPKRHAHLKRPFFGAPTPVAGVRLQATSAPQRPTSGPAPVTPPAIAPVAASPGVSSAVASVASVPAAASSSGTLPVEMAFAHSSGVPMHNRQGLHHLRRCSKQNCRLLFGSDSSIITEDEWRENILLKAKDLEQEWNAERNHCKDAEPCLKCPAWRVTCPERGWCSLDPHASAIEQACTAFGQHARKCMRTAMGNTFCALEVQDSGGEWRFTPVAPAICIAHILFNPVRVTVICVRPVVEPHTATGMVLPTVVRFDWYDSDRLHFELLPHVIGRLFKLDSFVALRLVDLEHEAVDSDEQLLVKPVQDTLLWPKPRTQRESQPRPRQGPYPRQGPHPPPQRAALPAPVAATSTPSRDALARLRQRQRPHASEHYANAAGSSAGSPTASAAPVAPVAPVQGVRTSSTPRHA